MCTGLRCDYRRASKRLAEVQSVRFNHVERLWRFGECSLDIATRVGGWQCFGERVLTTKRVVGLQVFEECVFNRHKA